MTTTAPPFAYFGGKQRIADRIVAAFPPHLHYVEPFAGSLAVLLAKPPALMETANDLDGDLMTFWRVLRDQPDELARVCALTPHSRAEHASVRDLASVPNLTDLERARRVWVAISQGRSGRLIRTSWRHYVKPATNIGMPAYLDSYVDRIAAAAARLHHVSLECRPALDLINTYGRDTTTLLYIDPPYLGATRADHASYRHEMRDEQQHSDLADALHAAASAVVLSGYHSPLYDTLYSDWHTLEIPAYTNQAGTPGARGNVRTEVLWSNRQLNSHPTLDFEQAIA